MDLSLITTIFVYYIWSVVKWHEWFFNWYARPKLRQITHSCFRLQQPCPAYLLFIFGFILSVSRFYNVIKVYVEKRKLIFIKWLMHVGLPLLPHTFSDLVSGRLVLGVNANVFAHLISC